MAAWQDYECFGGCSNPAGSAVDGNDSTFWASRSDGGWRVLLSSNPDPNCPQCVPARVIKKIRFYQDDAGGKHATKVDVTASVSASHFAYGIWYGDEPVTVITNVNVTTGWNEITLPANAAYRMYGIAATAFQGTGVWQVYTIQGFAGEPIPPPPPGDLFRGSVGAWDGNECFGGCPYQAPRAIDGDEGTEWHARSETWRVLAATSADPNNPSAIPPVPISYIRFFNGGNYATTVNINASYDVSYFAYGIWTMVNPVTIRTNVSVAYGWNEITLPGDPYRMYEIEATAHQGTGTWSMHTVQGYGTNTPGPKECDCGGAGYTTTSHPGDPVNAATGSFSHSFVDISIPGRSYPLTFSRTYNSLNANVTSTLGYGWAHTYNSFIDRDQDNNYIVHQGTGTIMPFRSDFSHDLRIMATLTNTNGTYILTTTHGLNTYYFTPIGNPSVIMLSKIVDRNGYTTTLAYDQQTNLLRTVTEPANRTLTFTYTNGLLDTVRDTGNRTVSFFYDGKTVTTSNLITATDVAGQNTSFTYETVNGYHRLLTMSEPGPNADGNRAVTANLYDPVNRVISQTDPMTRTMLFGYYYTGTYAINGTTRITDSLGLVTVQYYSNNMLTQVVMNPGSQQAQCIRSNLDKLSEIG